MIELKEDSIIFSIDSNDVYDLPFLWFRDNCQCDECRITETQEKQFLLNTVPLDIKPVKAIEKEDSLLISNITLLIVSSKTWNSYSDFMSSLSIIDGLK